MFVALTFQFIVGEGQISQRSQLSQLLGDRTCIVNINNDTESGIILSWNREVFDVGAIKLKLRPLTTTMITGHRNGIENVPQRHVDASTSWAL